MRRRLSSLQTVLVKIVLPAIFTLAFVFATIFAFVNEGRDEPPKGVLLFCAILLAIIFWDALRLKAVSVDDDYLYVSNYRKEVTIPLSQIDDVTESVWSNTHYVTIHLKSSSEFGGRVLFMPKVRFVFFGSHPVVRELRELAKVNSMTSEPD